MMERLFIVSIVVCLLKKCRAESVLLRCYYCPMTEEASLTKSNLQCLSNGYNVTCNILNSRCYTRIRVSSIEKGCTAEENCHVGDDYVCCGRKYCNGGYGLYPKTGYGQKCNIDSDCVQGEPDMGCAPERTGSINYACACLKGRRRQKAICLPNGSTPVRQRTLVLTFVFLTSLLKLN